MQTNIVKAVGGQLYVSPTYVAGSTATIACTNSDTSYVWFTISDSAITGLAYGGANWYSGSKIMFTGVVKANLSGQPDIVFASSPGELTANMNASNNKLQIKVKYDKASTYFSSAGTNLTWSDMSVMMYQINNSGTLYPIGVYIKAYGNDNKNSYIDIYGGTSATTSARLGLLDGVPAMANGTTPTGWGIYTNHGYFDGTIVSNSGQIGNFTLGTDLRSGTWGTSGSVLVSPGYSPSNAESVSIGGSPATGNTWAFTSGNNFGVTTSGSLYASSANISGKISAGANSTIGPWSVTATSIYKGNATMGSATTGAAYFGDNGLSITDKFKVTADGLLSATGASISGDINATYLNVSGGFLGGWHIDSSALYSTMSHDTIKTTMVIRNGYCVTTSLDQIKSSSSSLPNYYDGLLSYSRGILFVTPSNTTQHAIQIPFDISDSGDYYLSIEKITTSKDLYITYNIDYYNSSDTILYSSDTYIMNPLTYQSTADFTISDSAVNHIKIYIILNNMRILESPGLDIKIYKKDTGNTTYNLCGVIGEAIDRLPADTMIAIKYEDSSKDIHEYEPVPFLLQSDGTLTATSANISGEIHASSGSTFGDNISYYFLIGESSLELYGNTESIMHLGYDTITEYGGSQAWQPYFTFGKRAAGTGIGRYSVSEGIENTALGYYSHAEGYQTHANGSASHTEGMNNWATGAASHAGGIGNRAPYAYQTVIGKYSDSDNDSAFNTYAFVIGNGTSDLSTDRSNALTVDWSGNLVTAGDITANGSPVITQDNFGELIGEMQNILSQYAIVSVFNKNLDASAFASGADATATGTFSVVNGATDYWIIPISTFSYNNTVSNPTYTISGNTVTATCTVHNISSGTHSAAVRCLIFAVRRIASGSIGLLKADVINNLTSTITDQPLSAAQGKALNDKIINNCAKISLSSANVTNTSNAAWTTGTVTRNVVGGTNNIYFTAPTGTYARHIQVKKTGWYLVSIICRFNAVTNAGNVKMAYLWDATSNGVVGTGAMGRATTWEDLSSTELVQLTANHYYTFGGRSEDGNSTVSGMQISLVALPS